MGANSITKLGTLVFCACTGLLFLASATQRISCYGCNFYQDDSERCQCRLNPSQDLKECDEEVIFPIPDRRRSKNNPKKDSQEPRLKDVRVCIIDLLILGGRVELHRYDNYRNPGYPGVNIISKCNLDQKLLMKNNSLHCYCDTDWCNGQPFDFPNFAPTTTTKLPCPSTTTTTTTTTRKSTTTTTSTAGTSTTTAAVPTTPCDPNPPTKPTTPQSVTSSAFTHRDDYFSMLKYWISCRTTILVIGSLLLHSGVGHL